MAYRFTHDDFVRALTCLEMQEGTNYQEVRTQYRRLVREWHPDRYQQDPDMQARAHRRMAGINEAFTWLQQNQELFLIEWADAATEEPPRTPPAQEKTEKAEQSRQNRRTTAERSAQRQNTQAPVQKPSKPSSWPIILLLWMVPSFLRVAAENADGFSIVLVIAVPLGLLALFLTRRNNGGDK